MSDILPPHWSGDEFEPGIDTEEDTRIPILEEKSSNEERLNREWEREKRRIWRERRASGEPPKYVRKASKYERRKKIRGTRAAFNVASRELKQHIADLRNCRIGIDEFTRRVSATHLRFDERITRQPTTSTGKKLRPGKGKQRGKLCEHPLQNDATKA